MGKSSRNAQQKRPKPRSAGIDELIHFVQFAVVRFILFWVYLLPYRLRVPVGGWVIARLIAPVAGYNARTDANLSMIFPQMSDPEKARLTYLSSNNLGRMLTEIFSGRRFLKHIETTPFTGPGYDALIEAQQNGRPVILTSGHFGNYDVIRGGLGQQGIEICAIYQRMRNRYFNKFYVDRISTIGTPLYERSRYGVAQMVRFLKNGGCLAILIDQHMGHGETLKFFGKDAKTATSVSEMALKYDALLIPCYAVRQEDGISFKAYFEAPIEHSDPITMTQQLNDQLELQVRAHPEQWFWAHRRWK